jgi:hypothetical protein
MVGTAGLEPTIHRYRRSIGKSSTRACHQTFHRLTTGACCHTGLGYVPIRTGEPSAGIKSSTQIVCLDYDICYAGLGLAIG